MLDNVINAVIPDPNLRDYSAECRDFSWSSADRHFTWQATGRINIGYEAIDRHADDPVTAGKTCLICSRPSGHCRITFAGMRELSNRFANILCRLGIGKSDSVCLFLPGVPELYIAMAGCAKAGAVIVPLYSDYMTGAAMGRLLDAKPRVIVTDRERLGRLRLQELTGLEHILIAGDATGLDGRCLGWDREMEMASEVFEPVWVGLQDPFLIVYTSGPHGDPVGRVHVHAAMQGYVLTARWVLDLRADDVVLTLGRPGWFMNIVYNAFAPWLCGVANVDGDGIETADDLYSIIEQTGVSVLYTTPSRYRCMVDAGAQCAAGYDLGRLRHLLSVLEPLTPDLIYAVLALLKLPVYDTWWSAETGMITIAGVPCLPLKPGYLGKPLPGLAAAVFDDAGTAAPIFEMGRLALSPAWPCMAEGALETLTSDGRTWYLTGDVAFMDQDGYVFYQGHAGDVVITSAGKIGIREIERAVRHHPSVADAAVIRAASPGGPKRILAFVVPKAGRTADDGLAHAIIGHVAGMVSPGIAPEAVCWCAGIPRRKDGSINTLALKARALGLTD